METTTFVIFVWLILSTVIGVSDLIAVSELWKVRHQNGAIYELLYRSSNGIYKLIFALELIISIFRGPDASELDLIIVWSVVFLINALISVLFALYIKGFIEETFIRRIIRIASK